jgi:hypothetical protein
VATSITAFVGRSPRGPVNQPTDVFGILEYERTFGGLALTSAMGYAVRDFFLNSGGGSHAVIVRLFHSQRPFDPEAAARAPDAAVAAAQVIDDVQKAVDEVAKAASDAASATALQVAQAARAKANEKSAAPGPVFQAASAVARAAEAEAGKTGATSANVATAAVNAKGGKDIAGFAADLIAAKAAEFVTDDPLVAAAASYIALTARNEAGTSAPTLDSIKTQVTAAGARLPKPDPAAPPSADDAAVAGAGYKAVAQAVTALSGGDQTADKAKAAARAATKTIVEGTDPLVKKLAALALADAFASRTDTDFKAYAKAAQAAIAGADAYEEAIIELPLASSGGDKMLLKAASPGRWGAALKARVEVVNLNDMDHFDLIVTDGSVVERHAGLSISQDDARDFAAVLAQRSALVRWAGGARPGTRPQPHPAVKPRGADPFSNPNWFAAVRDKDKLTDGGALTEDDFQGPGTEARREGLYALNRVDLFNLLCLPSLDDNESAVIGGVLSGAVKLCVDRRAFLIIDPPTKWSRVQDVIDNLASFTFGDLGKNAALFFPRIQETNPLRENRVEDFAPSGAVAGVFARTDASRGVWKAPAGLDASIAGARGLTVKLDDQRNGQLNPLGVNCLRTFPAAGTLLWGARTRRGADAVGDVDNRYVPVRRLTLYIEESLYRGTKFAVFEPNDEPLWAQLRLAVGAFMQDLFRQGAFAGRTPREAYLVKCDGETTTANDRALGKVNVLVGFAPLRPAEFIILTIQQLAAASPTP